MCVWGGCSAPKLPPQDAHFLECEDAALFAHAGKNLDTQGELSTSPLCFHIFYWSNADLVRAV